MSENNQEAPLSVTRARYGWDVGEWTFSEEEYEDLEYLNRAVIAWTTFRDYVANNQKENPDG